MVITDPPIASVCPLRCGEPLSAADFEAVRRELVLRGCKWDPQVGDVGTLASFPLLISRSDWRELAESAERLTSELLQAEAELGSRVDLHGRLGMPRRLRTLLKASAGLHQPAGSAAIRTLRFDFHWTPDGWRISEVNSDVPGGFTESSGLPALMSRHYAQTTPAGDPGAVWADVIAQAAGDIRHAALLAAPGYMEDQQILAYLSGLLTQRGVAAHLATPQQIQWINRRAHLATAWYDGPLGIVVRFYQAEWFASLRRIQNMTCFYDDNLTPLTNPMSSALTESKRFPLVWDALETPLPTWRELLMETRDPRNVSLREGDWLLKSAFCNTGDEVAIQSLLSPKQWRRVRAEVLLTPWRWIAQRRFHALPIESDLGPIYPCIGVYTINGRAAGAYGRIARKALIDFEAIDVAVLIEDDDDGR